MKYFGTDGIRGSAYDYITYEMAYAVGRSLGLLENKKVMIARDTRESGNMISRALKSGIIDAGLEVMDFGIIATPILAHMSIKEKCAGVMITASHNPYYDNGIKVFYKGKKTTEEQEIIIEAVIDGAIPLSVIAGGKELDFVDPLPLYNKLFKNIKVISQRKIILDLANGATISSAKYVFDKICKNVDYIGDKPDGLNINKGVGSTHIDSLASYVVELGYDLGFSFDGDGDRVLAVDHTGRIIDGDLLIYIIACYLKEKRLLNNNLVVLTKMSNLGIISALKAKGIETIQTDIGDKYVLEALSQKKATIGGENSGHIINRYLLDTGDGVLNAAFILKILEEKGVTIEQLIKDVTFYPDRLFNLRGIDRNLVNDPRIIELVETIQYHLGSEGKVLVRPSGTEPLVRISASAKTQEEVDAIIKEISEKFQEIS